MSAKLKSMGILGIVVVSSVLTIGATFAVSPASAETLCRKVITGEPSSWLKQETVEKCAEEVTGGKSGYAQVVTPGKVVGAAVCFKLLAVKEKGSWEAGCTVANAAGAWVLVEKLPVNCNGEEELLARRKARYTLSRENIALAQSFSRTSWLMLEPA